MLVERFDINNPGWRATTVLVLDNSPCHRNPTVHDYIDEEQLPVLFTGPGSFDICAVEYFFSSIKRKFSAINIERMEKAWHRGELRVRGQKKEVMLGSIEAAINSVDEQQIKRTWIHAMKKCFATMNL
jgi:hypothetical protein